MAEIPAYALRAYALFYTRHGSSEAFGQKELEWIVSEPMRKKIFALLVKAGWLVKAARNAYKCVAADKAVKKILDYRVPDVLKRAEMPYALTGASAVEAWSDYSYVQRGLERSPYFVKVLKKDLKKWKGYLNYESVPNYVRDGSTVGEFVVLEPAASLRAVEKDGLKVEPFKAALKTAEKNELFVYACDYMKKRYGG